MGRLIRGCLQSFLKLVNSAIAMVGIAMIMYSLWMFWVWHKHMDVDEFPPSWFIYTFLGLGILLCVVTCSGHIAAETANGHCLSCAGVSADIFLNKHWEEDFPEDSTGRFDEFKNFVKSNFEVCKWIGSLIVVAQALSILLAMILRALGPDRGNYYDSDDDSTPPRLPLLRDHIPQHSTYVVGSHFPSKNETWN